ncbi:phosphoribosylformylglycinamidine synthase, purS [Chloroherpeton thalassium ATCC 35110]|uniref:Phosphoribosylformylglycinamidine synthase subunit PurS n=1 Tax=Chloroherpeton thalassium (strain ATCC 35110 / GB-78) TaxID=517418 RepID=B3QTD4_CHLT3|nr:phosphoribosylformylglycinamidine synthase subunit PurS [Chloroherpeton thalassium]ACF12680.1 phosphoribosylformylglycinamidine synthase, purS [Chloroherpeton thalassium ATCC 35110]
MAFNAKIRVTLRKSILDVQGKAVHQALGNLGYNDIDSVRIGKYIEVHINEEDIEKAKKITDDICHKLLSNPVMEDYSYDLETI